MVRLDQRRRSLDARRSVDQRRESGWAGVNSATWYRNRDALLDTYSVVEEAGNAGNSPLYRVDMKNPIVQRLDEVRDLAAAERNRATDPDRE